MEAKEPLERIAEIIHDYESGTYNSMDGLRELLRELSVNYYYLTTINVEAYNRWNAILWNRDIGVSVASARVRADNDVPELRESRKIMEAVKNVILSMQQELSILKSENR